MITTTRLLRLWTLFACQYPRIKGLVLQVGADGKASKGCAHGSRQLRLAFPCGTGTRWAHANLVPAPGSQTRLLTHLRRQSGLPRLFARRHGSSSLCWCAITVTGRPGLAHVGMLLIAGLPEMVQLKCQWARHVTVVVVGLGQSPGLPLHRCLVMVDHNCTGA